MKPVAWMEIHSVSTPRIASSAGAQLARSAQRSSVFAVNRSEASRYAFLQPKCLFAEKFCAFKLQKRKKSALGASRARRMW